MAEKPPPLTDLERFSILMERLVSRAESDAALGLPLDAEKLLPDNFPELRFEKYAKTVTRRICYRPKFLLVGLVSTSRRNILISRA